jgi:two-component system, cell cycle response regulator
MAARILIIEDNEINLSLMTYLLRAAGYEALEARDGEQGLRAAVAGSPDLILCDVQMPKLNGYAVAARIKAADDLKRIPLVAVTAFAMVGDREKTAAAGFDAYLSKPIDPETFVQQVEKLLRTDLRAVMNEQTVQPTTAAAERTVSGGPTILVVDDGPANLELAVSLLEPLGYRVITARHARAALEFARREHPELVISDVCMPEGSGFDFLRECKSDPALKAIPFIFLTSTMVEEKDRAKALAAGADAYLIRPIDPQQLLAAVETYVKRRSIR